MTTGVIIQLVNNVALLLALGLAWDLLTQRSATRRRRLLPQVVSGTFLGAIGIAVMLTPWQYAQGVVFDTRSIVLSIAGLFFGTLPTAMAVAMTGLFRLVQGGSGAWTGVLVILVSAAAGLAWRNLRRGALADISAGELYGFGVVVHAAMLLAMFTLPWPLPLNVLAQISLPVMLIYPIGEALLGWLMSDRLRRRRVDQGLAESEARLQALVNNARDSIFLKDAALRYTMVNRAMCELFGAMPESLLGKTDAELFGGEAAEHIQEVDARVLSGEVVEETPAKPVKERMHVFHTIKAPLRDADGKVVGLCGIARDITDRKTAEDAMREQALFLQQLLDTIADPIYYKDVQGVYRGCNAAFAAFQGLPREAIVGTTVYDVAPREVADIYNARDRDLFEHPGVQRYEIPVLRGDGSERDVLFTKATYPDAQGEVAGLVGVIVDLTDIKRTEAALAQERTLLRTLIDHLPDAVYIKDRQARKVLVNHADLQYIGRPEAEVLGKTDWELLPQEVAARSYSDDKQVLETGEPVINREELVVNTAGRARWLLTSKLPLRDARGAISGLVGIGRDITGRKEAEERLQKAREELERSNRDLEQFAYVASHDLQEPLRMVTGFLQLLSARYRDRLDADANEFIGFAVDGATRMQKLITDLLEYSRVGTRGKPLAPTDSAAALAEACANLGAAMTESEAQVTGEALPVVLADEMQLVELLQNLISNAIKFHGDEPPRVEVSAERTGDEWRFAVRDNGIGIEPQYRERIFGMFQRLHSRSEYPGTGIGLAVCQRIVERHGGRIWVESTPGRGSTFYFTMRAAEEVPADDPQI